MPFDPRSIIHSIMVLWSLSEGALHLDQAILLAAETTIGIQVAFAIIFLAGLSAGFGTQSVVLFVNRVSRGNFLLNLLMSGIVFMLGAMAWIVSIWLIAVYGFGNPHPIMLVTRVVSLGYLPLLFGFLIIAPYAGPGIGYVLHAWSFLIVLVAVQVLFDLVLWQALVCTLSGWLIVQILRRAVSHPLAIVDRWLWYATTQRDTRRTLEDIPLNLIDVHAERLNPTGSNQ